MYRYGSPFLGDFVRLSYVSCVLMKLNLRLHAEHTKIPLHREDLVDLLDWIEKNSSGQALLSRLKQAGDVEHCVAVDALLWPRTILDSAEAYTLILSAKLLRLCGGYSVTELKVREDMCTACQPDGRRRRCSKRGHSCKYIFRTTLR